MVLLSGHVLPLLVAGCETICTKYARWSLWPFFAHCLMAYLAVFVLLCLRFLPVVFNKFS